MDRKEDKPSKKIDISAHSEQGQTPATEIHESAQTPGAATPGATPGTGYQFPATPHSLAQVYKPIFLYNYQGWGWLTDFRARLFWFPLARLTGQPMSILIG